MYKHISIFLTLYLCVTSSAIATNDSNFDALNGKEINAVFQEIDNVQIPEVGDGWNGGEWRPSFKSDGSWEDESRGVWGSWRVEADKLCISAVGGDDQWSAIFEGCFGVFVDPSEAKIAGLFPGVSKKLFLMKEFAYEEIARARPPTAQPAAAGTPRVANNISKADEQSELAKQRLALERQRFEAEAELQKMRLALQKQKLEQEKQALLLKQQQTVADHAKPVIETTETVVTSESTVRIAGVARDNGRLTRVEVGGRRADVDRGTGRFAAEVPVKLGRNKVVISATDANGNKAERAVLVTRKRNIPDIAFGSYHAVVIGIDDYESLPKLKTAIADARAVAATLREDYGYTVKLLENPDRGDIIDTFDELREVLSEQDNLLIYYAGHGWLDKQSGRGYWLPIDARSDRRSRWVSNTDLTDALQALLAKHVMVVADSCYSGTLTRSIKVPERNKAYLERIAKKRARVVLSSGGLEPVADSGGGKHSVFAAQFLKALRSNEGVLDGTKLFEKVRNTVVLNADQTPEYSDIRKAGHEGGDFLFVRRD